MGMYSKMRTRRRVPEAQQTVAKTQNVGDSRTGDFAEVSFMRKLDLTLPTYRYQVCVCVCACVWSSVGNSSVHAGSNYPW